MPPQGCLRGTNRLIMIKRCQYTRDEIISECRNSRAEELYAKPFINYRSVTKDTRQLCTEVVAEYLLDNIDSLLSIPIVSRENEYRIRKHQSRAVPVGSNRKEEAIAIGLLRESLDNGKTYDFGKVFDYQIPLKAKKSDACGKIDVVSKSGNDVFLLELKKQDSTETMLRCVLESFTYSRQLDKDKFLKEYGISSSARIIPAPLVYKDGKQYEDYLSSEQQFLKELIKRLSVKVFFM